MKIIEWNINQRSNYGNVDIIPPLVAEQINELKADIVIITEFYKVSGWEAFVSTLDSYNTFVTENRDNEVLIAIKKKYTQSIGYIRGFLVIMTICLTT